MKLIEELMTERKDVVLTFDTITTPSHYARIFRLKFSAEGILIRHTVFNIWLISGSCLIFASRHQNLLGYRDVRDGMSTLLSEAKNG